MRGHFPRKTIKRRGLLFRSEEGSSLLPSKCVKCGELKDESRFPRWSVDDYRRRNVCYDCAHAQAKKVHAAKLEKKAGRPRPEKCEVCGRVNLNGKPLCFDHDHKTGAFRGWLCFSCNFILGHVNDDHKILEDLIVYLKQAVKLNGNSDE